MVALFLLSLLLATTALAAPSQKRDDFHGACTVPASAFDLPWPLPPIQSPPLYTAVGFGVQNYTCTSSGNYSNVGAVARLFDASCLYGSKEFLNIEIDVFDFWTNCPTESSSDSEMASLLKQHWNMDPLADYYFVEQDNSLVPVFDFRSTGQTTGNPNAIFFGAKNEVAPSPDGDVNIDWVQQAHVAGGLANAAYRVFTVLGQPPSRCTPGSPDISIKYATKYLFV